jgi:ketosteroid isomerase-like protein
MNSLALLLFLWGATASGATAATATDDVRNAETSFAQAFADRDAAKFAALIADDATFTTATTTLAGKPEIVKGWSAYFAKEKAPFSWHPERVYTNAAGDLGLSIGPVYDAAGNHIGDYSSIWQKQHDGTWKIVFDGPGSRVCPK